MAARRKERFEQEAKEKAAKQEEERQLAIKEAALEKLRAQKREAWKLKQAAKQVPIAAPNCTIVVIIGHRQNVGTATT